MAEKRVATKKPPVKGSYWVCPRGHEWRYRTLTVRQVKEQGLNLCPDCGRRGKGVGW